MNYPVRSPLTPIELARRAEALSANRAPEATIDRSDARDYGEHAASIIRNCKRSVALSAIDGKAAAFKAAGEKLGEAVRDRWLPKAIVADRLQEIADAHNSFGMPPEEIQQLIADALQNPEVKQVEPQQRPQKRRLISHRASELEPERLVWVWPGRVPEGKLVLLGGPPGLGKSQLTAFMAATVSSGGHWPCGEGSTQPGDVIFMSAEDGVQDTIVPRLMAAGANRQRVHIVSAATKSDGTGRKTFSLKTDVDLLEEMARKLDTVRLIVVDPISAYMGGSDGNGNVETREVLEPLSDMANRLKIAVVAVTHLNKGGAGNQSALNRFAGSIAFVAAARAAFAVIEDPEDDERRLLLQAKNNLGRKCQGLAFRLEQREIAEGVISSNVMFEGDHVTQSIDEALTASESRGGKQEASRSNKDEAIEFLRDLLSNGPIEAQEVERQARAAGLVAEDKPLRQNKAFRNARAEIGVLIVRDGFGPGSRYVWSRPGAPCAPENSMRALSETRAHMDNQGAHDTSETGSAGSGPTEITTANSAQGTR